MLSARPVDRGARLPLRLFSSALACQHSVLVPQLLGWGPSLLQGWASNLERRLRVH